MILVSKYKILCSCLINSSNHVSQGIAMSQLAVNKY